jgi:hypothetical protein
MAVDLISDLWDEIKRYVSPIDRAEAADVLVNLLIDNDYDADQILAAFKGDSDVKHALQSYLDDVDDESDQDGEEDPYDD